MPNRIVLFLVFAVMFIGNLNAGVSATISSYTNASCACCSNGSATVTAGNGSDDYSYLWSSGDTTSTASGLSPGNYSVTVTDLVNQSTAVATINIGPAVWDWALAQGGTVYSGEVPNMEGNTSDIAADESGNTYLVGSVKTQGLFGGVQLVSAGGFDVFLVKYDVNGNVIWARTMGGSGDDIGKAVAVDPSGNVCITGYFEGDTMFVEGFPLIHNGDTASPAATGNRTGRSTIFTAKFTPSGALLWARKGGGNYTTGNYDNVPNDRAYAITTDKAGNVFITGSISSDTVTFDTVQFINAMYAGSIGRIFIAKYDVDGNILWVKPIEISGYGRGMGIATDTSGNVFITGLTDGIFTFVGNNYTTSGWDIFTAKYNPSGSPLWGEIAGSPPDDAGHAIAVDQNGDAYVTGWLQSSPGIFGTDTLISTTGWDIFLAKYDGANGNTLWAKRAGSNGIDQGYGITVDNCRNIYLTGMVAGKGQIAYFDSLSISATEYLSTFVAGYNTAGKALFATSLGGPPQGNYYDDIAYGITADYQGNILVTGSFSSDTMKFGCISIATEKTNGVIFVAKMDNTLNSGSASINIPASYNVCQGDSVVLTATGADNYNWTPSTGLSDTTGASVTAYPSATTIYAVTNSSGGCTISAATLVNVNPAPQPVITLTDSLICANDSARLCVPDTFAFYVWNNGVTTACIQAMQAGGYWVSVTNDGGCTGVSGHREVAVYPVSPVSIVLQGDTLTSFGAVSYQWRRNDSVIAGATSSVYIVSEPGDYSVQVVDTNGCTAVSSGVEVVLTGITDNLNGDRLSVYPNPASNEVFISFTGSSGVNTIRFLNALGQEVKRQEITPGSNWLIPVDDLAPGLYEVVASGQYSLAAKKLLKL